MRYREFPDTKLMTEGSSLKQFEVAVAVNVEAPYRFAQDILWLQVMAENHRSASEAALRWILAGPEEYEATGLVRLTTVHSPSLGKDHLGRPLMIYWSLPVLKKTPPGAVVRDPVTGLRIGFVAHPQAERRWLPKEAEGSFCLLSRKPTPSSEPAGLAPLVEFQERGAR